MVKKKINPQPPKDGHIAVKDCKGKKGVWVTPSSIILPPLASIEIHFLTPKEQHNRNVDK